MVHYIFHGLSVIIIIYLLSKIGKLYIASKNNQIEIAEVMIKFNNLEIMVQTLNKQLKLYAKINEAFQEQEFEIIPDLNEKLRKEIQFQKDFFKE